MVALAITQKEASQLKDLISSRFTPVTKRGVRVETNKAALQAVRRSGQLLSRARRDLDDVLDSASSDDQARKLPEAEVKDRLESMFHAANRGAAILNKGFKPKESYPDSIPATKRLGNRVKRAFKSFIRILTGHIEPRISDDSLKKKLAKKDLYQLGSEDLFNIRLAQNLKFDISEERSHMVISDDQINADLKAIAPRIKEGLLQLVSDFAKETFLPLVSKESFPFADLVVDIKDNELKLPIENRGEDLKVDALEMQLAAKVRALFAKHLEQIRKDHWLEADDIRISTTIKFSNPEYDNIMNRRGSMIISKLENQRLDTATDIDYSKSEVNSQAFIDELLLEYQDLSDAVNDLAVNLQKANGIAIERQDSQRIEAKYAALKLKLDARLDKQSLPKGATDAGSKEYLNPAIYPAEYILAKGLMRKMGLLKKLAIEHMPLVKL